MERILWRAFEQLELRFRDGGHYRFDAALFDDKAKRLTEQLVTYLLQREEELEAEAEEEAARVEIEAEATVYLPSPEEMWRGGGEEEPPH